MTTADDGAGYLPACLFALLLVVGLVLVLVLRRAFVSFPALLGSSHGLWSHVLPLLTASLLRPRLFLFSRFLRASLPLLILGDSCLSADCLPCLPTFLPAYLPAALCACFCAFRPSLPASPSCPSSLCLSVFPPAYLHSCLAALLLPVLQPPVLQELVQPNPTRADPGWLS